MKSVTEVLCTSLIPSVCGVARLQEDPRYSRMPSSYRQSRKAVRLRENRVASLGLRLLSQDLAGSGVLRTLRQGQRLPQQKGRCVRAARPPGLTEHGVSATKERVG